MITNTASGLWDNLAIWPAGTPAGGPAATTQVTIAAGTAVATDPDNNAGILSRTASTTITGKLTLSQSGSFGVPSNLGKVSIPAGGLLFLGGDSTQPGVLLTINGNVTLAGGLAVLPGSDGSGSLAIDAETHDRARTREASTNYNPFSFSVLGWQTSATPCTWTLIQQVDHLPAQFTLAFVQAWTCVAINERLGGIGIFTTDYAGNLLEPLQPPVLFVYRNGALERRR